MANLLIVDDEFRIRVAMMEVLEQEGHTGIPASNASEAILQLKSHPEIDAVFTDIGMPLGSGWELLTYLQANHPTLPVVVVSAWGGNLNEDQILANGICKVIGKPFTLSEMRFVLREILRPPSPISRQM